MLWNLPRRIYMSWMTSMFWNLLETFPKELHAPKHGKDLYNALKHVGVDLHGLACSKTCHDGHTCFESCLTHVKKKLHALKHTQKKEAFFQMFPFKICQKWFKYCFETFYKHIDKNL
jgi:hypothetical protein